MSEFEKEILKIKKDIIDDESKVALTILGKKFISELVHEDTVKSLVQENKKIEQQLKQTQDRLKYAEGVLNTLNKLHSFDFYILKDNANWWKNLSDIEYKEFKLLNDLIYEGLIRSKEYFKKYGESDE